MLRRPHVEPFVSAHQNALVVSFLEDDDGRVVAFLDRLCRLVRRLEGRPRRTVVEALRRQERRVRDAQRLAGIAKTLLDLCSFRAPPGAERAPAVRTAVFLARGERWPPLSGDDDAPYRAAAAALGLAPSEVHRILYADRPEARVLVRAPPLDGARLLERYNLELARGVLLDATRVVIGARGGWRGIFRAVKLARLMFRIERAGRRGYRVELSGPAAPFIARPQRYGVRLMRVVPALLRAPSCTLEAQIVRGERHLPYRLDARTPFGRRARRRRHGPAAYDSRWERALADEFADKLGAERAGWTLAREDTPVPAGDELFLPDFTLRHRDGREALVEIIGFWTPEYLDAKLRKVDAAGLDNLILVAYEGLAAGAAGARDRIESAGRLAHDTGALLWFKNRPRIAPVLRAAERVARRPPARPATRP